MDPFPTRTNKVEKCAKAALGRGFKYFLLFNNGKCLVSYDGTYSAYGYERITKKYCYYYCIWSCYYRCYYYLVPCGNGFGDYYKMNLYTMYYCKFSYLLD